MYYSLLNVSLIQCLSDPYLFLVVRIIRTIIKMTTNPVAKKKKTGLGMPLDVIADMRTSISVETVLPALSTAVIITLCSPVE
jgi:hypothetical protein